MNPDENQPSSGDDRQLSTPEPRVPSIVPPSRDEVVKQQQAAANVVRQQIDQLYGASSVQATTTPVVTSTGPTPTQSAAAVSTNPYARTHSDAHTVEADRWKDYHTAWQNYYQKYYESYYSHQSRQVSHVNSGVTGHYFSAAPVAADADESAGEQTLTRDEALLDLRQKLLGKVQSSTKTIRKSRHFIPIVAALAVVLLFLFLQYNRVLIANVQAYVSPGKIDPQNIVVDPNTAVSVSPEPKLIIPKINVDVPAVYGVGNDHDSQMAAMEKGVAHFAIPGASSHPGQVGNTVLSGHSSNDLFDVGDYKFIFAQLDKLQPGDSIYAHYEGIRYTYVVTRTEVVKPSEVGKLVYATDKPVLTLITCTPLGTALNRLLVTAEQVSPDPNASQAAPVPDANNANSPIPGNSPTLFERLFGGR